MDPQTQVALLERLLARLETDEPEMPALDAEIPARNYVDPARAEAEVKALFRKLPLVLGHASRLASPGDFITSDALGLPILATCDRDGVPRAFLNVCRHRGTQLVAEGCGSDRKAFVCPYHGWTYDLRGKLTHVPSPEAFPSLDRDKRSLVPLSIEARNGLLWVHPVPGAALDLDGFLGGLDADLKGLGLDRHRVYRKVTQQRRCNWKLVIDAFLEGYHVQHLHRKTLHRFFRDLVFIHDRRGPHARMLSSRTHTRELSALDRGAWDLRGYTTLYYFFFPNTVVLFHPDFASLLRVFPDGPERCVWDHEMLIPADADTPERQEHWQKSFTLIEETVFQKEDLIAAESIQQGMRAGANETLTLGRLEFLIKHFHDDIEAALTTPGDPALHVSAPSAAQR
jgi:phenylpropionate dioxygenase-like ring-hydroxylating dioxygenase large terminal subunit